MHCSQAPAQAAAQWTGQEWSGTAETAAEAWQDAAWSAAAEEKAEAGSLSICPVVLRASSKGLRETPVKSRL